MMKEILGAEFVAIIIDETIDITNKCQVPTLLSYIYKWDEVQDRFLGYNDFSGDWKAIVLADHVFQTLK